MQNIGHWRTASDGGPRAIVHRRRRYAARVGRRDSRWGVITVLDHAALMPWEARDYFEERAAIRQFDGMQDKSAAELGAYLETCKRFALFPLAERPMIDFPETKK